MTLTEQTAATVIRPFAVTPMALDDVPHVVALEERSFPTPWSALSYRQEIVHNDLSRYWVIRALDVPELPALLAYGGYWLLGEEAHISTVAAHPDHRRCKLGEWMMLILMADARDQGASEVTLEVRISNQAAIALYRSLGFEEVGLRKQYYASTYDRPSEDALLLTLSALDAGAVWRPLALRLELAYGTARSRLLTRR